MPKHKGSVFKKGDRIRVVHNGRSYVATIYEVKENGYYEVKYGPGRFETVHTSRISRRKERAPYQKRVLSQGPTQGLPTTKGWLEILELLNYVLSIQMIQWIVLNESEAFKEVNTRKMARFRFVGTRINNDDRQNSIQLEVAYENTDQRYFINLSALLSRSTVIQWNRRMPIPTIKRFIKKYDKAQARADYLTTLPKRMLKRILTLGPRNVVPLLNNRACEESQYKH